MGEAREQWEGWGGFGEGGVWKRKKMRRVGEEIEKGGRRMESGAGGSVG